MGRVSEDRGSAGADGWANRPLVITGMHRSGTSLTAALLQAAQVDLGTDLVGPDVGNPKGHFENRAFVAFHQAVLRSQGLDILGYTEASEIQLNSDDWARAKALISQQPQDHLWGWKDPRTTLFLDVWSTLLPEARFIFVYRSPWEVVDSLYRRGTDAIIQNDPAIAVKMWLLYNRCLLQFRRRFPEKSLLISIYTITRDPSQFLSLINAHFKLQLPVSVPNIFDPSLLQATEQLSERRSLLATYFPETLALYQALNHHATGLDTSGDEIGLEITEEERGIIHEQSRHITYQDWFNERQLTKQVHQLTTTLETVQADLQSSQTQVSSLQAERDRLAQAVAEHRAQLMQVQTKSRLADYRQQRSQKQLAITQAAIAAMQTSKFWQLRSAWFAVKSRLGWVTETPIRPLRILMVSNALNLTGAPLHQYDFTRYLQEQKLIEPVIFAAESGPLAAAYRDRNIPVIIHGQHPLATVQTLADYWQAVTSLAVQWGEGGFDLIYANTIETFYALDCAQLLGIPSVWNIHESEPWQTYFQRFWFDAEVGQRALECFALPAKVVFVAQATCELYQPLQTRSNFTVIHNGLNQKTLLEQAAHWSRSQARQALNLPEKTVVILLLGTVCARKGQLDLVNAIAQLPPDCLEQLHCYIVGDRPGEYSQLLTAAVANLPEPIQAKITIVPETPDTAQYYQAADIFVCTSRVESYPRVILEAMFYGLPIVTTPVFGIKEQVKAGVNGVFYTPDRPEELATALQQLLENPTHRQHLAAHARRVLNSLSTFEQMAHAYAQVFQAAVAPLI
ncbi:glycosyltransferase [Trichothermofontia sp.]